MAAPPEAVPTSGAYVDSHPKIRVQFWLDGPFDPIQTLSATFIDDGGDEQESIVLGGEHPQYELWSLIATMAAEYMSRYGVQGTLL